MERHDLFDNVHKGLRCSLAGLGIEGASLTPGDWSRVSLALFGRSARASEPLHA